MGEKQGQANNARLIAALKFYACSCEPGRCAMSVDGDDVPCDDQLCGRTARDALSPTGEDSPANSQNQEHRS